MDEMTGVLMSLGSPGLIVLAVLALTWVIKASTPLKAATAWLPLIAVGLGGILGALLLPGEYTAKYITAAVVQGMGLALLSAGGKDLLTGMLTIGKKMKNGGPTILLMFILPALMAGGCMGGHDFMLSAPTAVVEVLSQVEVGVDEYHAAATEDFDNAAAKSRAALQTTLAKYLVTVAALPATAVTVEQASEQAAKILTEYDAQVASLTTERANEAERYAKLQSLMQWGREVAAQIIEIETRRYDTVQQLREKAGAFVRQRITGRETK